MKHWVAIAFLGSMAVAACGERMATNALEATPPLRDDSVRPLTANLTGIDERQAEIAISAALAELENTAAVPVPARKYFQVIAVTRDSTGVTKCLFAQHSRGIKVIDHEALVHTNADGVVRVGAVRFLRNTERVAEATLSPDQAMRSIPSEQIVGLPSLVIWPFPATAPRLAYEITTEKALQRELVYVDARTGEIAGRRALTMTRH